MFGAESRTRQCGRNCSHGSLRAVLLLHVVSSQKAKGGETVLRPLRRARRVARPVKVRLIGIQSKGLQLPKGISQNASPPRPLEEMKMPQYRAVSMHRVNLKDIPPLLYHSSQRISLFLHPSASRRRLIHHRAWPLVGSATGRTSPPVRSLLSITNLSLVLDGRAATTATRLDHVGRKRPFQMVLVSETCSVNEGKDATQAAESRHRHD